jgi:hypothetical protein
VSFVRKAAGYLVVAVVAIVGLPVALYLLLWLTQPLTGIPVSAWIGYIQKANSSVVSQLNAIEAAKKSEK